MVCCFFQNYRQLLNFEISLHCQIANPFPEELLVLRSLILSFQLHVFEIGNLSNCNLARMKQKKSQRQAFYKTRSYCNSICNLLKNPILFSIISCTILQSNQQYTRHKVSKFSISSTTCCFLFFFFFFIVAIIKSVGWYLILILICISLWLLMLTIFSYAYWPFVYHLCIGIYWSPLLF